MPAEPTGDRDRRFMRMALGLARRGRGRTEPNPRVGSVVVSRGRVVGRGYHRRAGSDHAEIAALKDAGGGARGGELYVNLEPCCHQGLTGPCVEAIIKARIERVVVGMTDPNPLVCGKGIAALRRAGVEVLCGVLEPECLEENRAFATYIRQARPHVTFKTAVTLDGRVAAYNGQARWVTGEPARREARRLRALNQAIAVGVGTILADDPRLTCRIPGRRDPIRVVVDSRLRTPPTAKILAEAARSKAPTWIITTPAAPAVRARRLERAGARLLRVDARGGRVALQALLAELGRQQVTSLLLEGGPTLAGAFWQARLVDEVVAFVAPKVLGDPSALPMLRGPTVERMEHATRLENTRIRRIGEDLMISGMVFASVESKEPEVPRCSRA